MRNARTPPTFFFLVSLFSFILVVPRVFASGGAEEPTPPAFDGEYAALEEDANEMFAGLEAIDAPVEPLVLLYKEGISKSVSPDDLQQAARLEYSRLRFAAELFDEYYPQEEHPREAFEALTLGLSSGIAPELPQSLAEQAGASFRLGDLVAALGRLRRWHSIEVDRLRELGGALLESELTRQSYDAVATILVRAMTRGETEESIDRVVRILQNGGGLVQISRELDNRRTP